jgi:hypothetical protein
MPTLQKCAKDDTRCRVDPADRVVASGTFPGDEPLLFWGEPDGDDTEFETFSPEPGPPDTLEVDVDTTDEPAGTAFATLVQAIAATLLGIGATRGAAVLPRLIEGEPVDAERLGPEATHALSRARIAEVCGTTLRLCDEFRAVTQAWRRVLNGSGDDLGACGATTLDRWAADLAAALVGAPARADELRRELRKRGVAAFGMLEAA